MFNGEAVSSNRLELDIDWIVAIFPISSWSIQLKSKTIYESNILLNNNIQKLDK